VLKKLKQFRLKNELEDMKIEFFKIYHENKFLKSKIKQLEDEQYKKMTDDLDFKNKMYNICKKIFTKNQVDILVSGKRANKWYNEDIASCIGLRSISPKCYKYMYGIGYPVAG